MPQEWLQITFESERPLDVERILEACGAASVTIMDAADDPLYEPLPGETPLWKLSQIRGLFNGDADSDAILSIVTRELELVSAPPHQVETLTDQDWTRAWMTDYHPLPFGNRLWVCPLDQSVTAEDAVVIKLDPGLAFGTGTHPTTAMCLQSLDAMHLINKSVIDFGCGSGILGIAAALLGASTVLASDIDPQAIAATQSNAEINNVSNRVQTIPANSKLGELPAADIVLANILSNTLIELNEQLGAMTLAGGQLILSGILTEQVDDVIEAYATAFVLDTHLSQADWHCLVLRKQEPKL